MTRVGQNAASLLAQQFERALHEGGGCGEVLGRSGLEPLSAFERVNVTGVSGTPAPGTGKLFYRVGSAGSFSRRRRTCTSTVRVPSAYE